jgi:acyl-CoA thioesterase FadM/lysophospholipase L1-like esterase
MPVVLCYGDSNTHGTTPITRIGQIDRHPPGSRWPDVMAHALGPDTQVIAEGLPGRTTVHDDPVEGGCRNGIATLPAILHSHRPIDLLVVMLGTNDLKPRFSVTAFDIARSIERLCLAARAEGVVADLMIVAPVPVLETGVLAEAFAGAGTRQAGLAAHLSAVAGRIDAGFVDAAAHIAVSPVDGIHWDAASHKTFGAVMAEAVAARLSPPVPAPDTPLAPVTLDRTVPPAWADYNGHMNEAHFVSAFSAAADRLLLWAGMDAAAIAAGQSVFTVETHVRYLAEVQIGDRIRVTTRVLEGGTRKFHIWHELFVGETLCATGEQLLLHVDLTTRRPASPPPAMANWLARAARAHAALPLPEGLGRHVGQPR